MNSVMNVVAEDRVQAGRQLSQKLIAHRNTNAVIIGISQEGLSVASGIAEVLGLSVDIMPYRKMTHPADRSRTIGSVSETETFIDNCPRGIPQDYIYRQMELLRNSIIHERSYYYGDIPPQQLLYRVVILVDNVLYLSDGMIACLRSIRKQMPLKIIVAVPVVTAEAARIIRNEVDDLVFIQMEAAQNSSFLNPSLGKSFEMLKN